ncbi:hypothetical protein BC831DRAFT_444810 [Entophlyctis helioformis]|nr:hypothetical protein BC831DRAFT_444810 [Entophlyctis helioformis]
MMRFWHRAVAVLLALLTLTVLFGGLYWTLGQDTLSSQQLALAKGILAGQTGVAAAQADAGTAPDLAAAAAAAPHKEQLLRKNRLVVSMSSFPGRLDHMNVTIPSLTYQQSRVPDLVLLLIPHRIERLNISASSSTGSDGRKTADTNTSPDPRHKDLPQSLVDLEASLGGLLRIVRPAKDYGPSTKLLGALEIEKDPHTIVVTADDDMIYHPDTLLTLETVMDHSPTPIAPCFICEFYPWWTRLWGGPSVRQEWEGVCKGWSNAYAAVAFRVHYFDESVFDYSRAPSGCKLHDDVWISGALYRKGIRPWNVRPGFDSKIKHFRHPTLSINSVKNGEKGFRNPCIEYFDYFGI